MLWVDLSYLRQISYRLEGFKEKKLGELYNCRCSLCGDSSKKSNKKRGYFYTRSGTLMYNCHNCNASMTFGTFLKEFDRNLYDRYYLEKFKSNHITFKEEPENIFKISTPPVTVKYVPNITEGLKSIDQLKVAHPARQYVENRKLPVEFWPQMFYVQNYITWSKGHTDKFKTVGKEADHPRLIIPWYSGDGVLFAYIARAFDEKEVKYFKIIIDDSYPPFFGMNRCSKPEYIVEGPLDAMFLPCCIAVGTSSLHMYDGDATYISDRDVRNPDIMKEVKRLIKMNKKVCLLPPNLPGKDINDFVKNGMSSDEVKGVIDNNTFQGLEAQLKFTEWSRV